MSTLPRGSGNELMDAATLDPGQLSRSLEDLRRVNRWLGGTRVVLHHLGGLMKRHPRARWRVLDLATGSGDIPLTLARWARERGQELEVVATDNHPVTLELARRHTAAEPAVRTALADALALPFADGSFDVALISTAFHHFDDEADCIQVLREMDRVSRVGWIVNDLARSRAALAGARLLAVTAWRRHPITRHDGPLSVRRAFTVRELRALAARAGFRGVQVRGHAPFRLALVAEKE
jgi:SAM-dependent methyltransferase